MTDEELINGMLNGDETAFKALVNTYKHMVYNTLLGFVQNADDAQDLSQDVFIKVYESISRFKQQCKLSTWLYRISVSQALEFIRRRNRKKRGGFILSLFGAGDELIYEPADFVHPGVLAENKERSAILFKAINRLPENQKTAFLLQKVEQCSQQQVAEIMQLTEGAVESLLSRAKANLKKWLQHYYNSL